MNILFIHQNFPGQFKHLAPYLAEQGHTCVALTLKAKETGMWKGVNILPYNLPENIQQNAHPWVQDFDTKVIRGHACFMAARKIREAGFTPDLILAHPGWGETLFLHDVWPEAKIGLYYEYYYRVENSELSFDPEFPRDDIEQEHLRLRLKNINNDLHFKIADAGISPTIYQASTFPPEVQDQITVCHDGIDTNISKPNPDAVLKILGILDLKHGDEVITFINRNLEPHRGYHSFMRAVPQILAERPNAKIVIVGGAGAGYGLRPPTGKSWKNIFRDEVRDQIPPEDRPRVIYTGRMPHDKLTALLQISSVHVYLTYPFVLSWSLMEAMSCEAAIVASDTEPVREMIEDGKTGRLVDFFDHDALAERVCELLNDPDQRKALGQAARQHIVDNYDLETVCLPKQLEWVEQINHSGQSTKTKTTTRASKTTKAKASPKSKASSKSKKSQSKKSSKS